MKRALVMGLISALVGSSIYRLGTHIEREQSFTTARFAAEWGCLVSAQLNCAKLGEPAAYPCMDEAIVWCPKRAEAFEKFLRR
jgi:hypothetical protein